MRPTRLLPAASTFLALAVSASTALADPVVSGQWYEFGFNTGPGGTAFPCAGGCTPSSGGNAIDAPATPWTHTSAAPFTFTVTDAFLNVNSFSLFDFGVLVGSTPAATNNGSCGSDPVPCLADPLTSHAAFGIGAGAHSFTIVNNEGIGGAAYFRIDGSVTPVPEPSTVALVAGGLLGLVAAARRRRA